MEYDKKKEVKKKTSHHRSKPTNKKCDDIIYFDNNATTLISDQAKEKYIELLKCYNISSDSKLVKPIKQKLEKYTDEILAHCNVSSATHTPIFTSGGTESNCFIIRACVKAYKKKLAERGSDLRPHVIASAVEHHSIMECIHDLVETGEIDATHITPTIYGNILAEDVEREIKPNTCLISIMFANNEIPVINNIREIGAVAHKNRIPMHSDCVQVFGKYRIDLEKNNIDAISASAHKFYGPKGAGLLIISNALIEGYGLTAEISGSQQHGLRGGTENVAGIASMITALKYAFVNRKAKNEKLFSLRDKLLTDLKEHFTFADYEDYISVASDATGQNTQVTHNGLELVSLGPPDDKKSFILPNTVLLAICKNRGKPFCNVELKKFLDSKNMIVSIGSACLTKSDKASHVLNAIGAPPVVKRGVIRISFGDLNTKGEVDKFVQALVQGIKKQCADLSADA